MSEQEPFRPGNEFVQRIQDTGVDPEKDIQDPRLRSLVSRIGRNAQLGMVNADALRQEYVRLDQAQAQSEVSGNPVYDQTQLDAILIPLANWIQQLTTQGSNPNPLDTLVQIQQRQLSAELQEVIAGQDAFFRSIYFQSAGSPDLGKETWYNSLTPREQILLALQNKFLFALNGVDTLPGKKAGPVKGFDAYKSFLHIRKEELEDLFQSTGFCLAFGTIRHDLFEYGELNPDRKSNEPIMRGLVLSNNGRDIIRDQDRDTHEQKFNIYREGIVRKLEDYFRQNPDEIEFKLLAYPNLTQEMINRQIRVAAESYFGMAWNFLSVGNSVESGDTTRKVSSSDPTVIVPSWRNMIHPHDQAKNKWVRGQAEKIGTEEDLFGILGRWFQERIRHDPKIKRDFEEYKPGLRYFQRVTTGSLFDHAYFADNQTNLSQVFCNNSNLERVDNEMYQYRQPMGFDQLKDADIGYVYTDILDSVIKVQTLITTPEPIKDPAAAFAVFIGAMMSLQGRSFDIDQNQITDQLLHQAYEPDEIEDLVVAAIGAVSGGFAPYTNEIILNIGPQRYDRFVYGILSDDRIYKILGLGIGDRRIKAVRNKLMSKFHAHEPGTRETTMEIAGKGERSKILKETVNEARKWTKAR